MEFKNYYYCHNYSYCFNIRKIKTRYFCLELRSQCIVVKDVHVADGNTQVNNYHADGRRTAAQVSGPIPPLIPAATPALIKAPLQDPDYIRSHRLLFHIYSNAPTASQMPPSHHLFHLSLFPPTPPPPGPLVHPCPSSKPCPSTSASWRHCHQT